VTPRGVLTVTAALSAFAIGAISVARFLHLLGQGIALSTIAAAMVLYSAVTAISEVPTGIAGDRFGRGRIRTLGLVASAVGAAIIGFSVSVPALLGAFMLMAFGTATLSGAAEAWYVDTVDETGANADDPTHVLALAQATSAKNLGLAVGAAAVLVDAVITVVWMRDSADRRSMNRTPGVRVLALSRSSRAPVITVAGIYFVLGVLLAATELLTPARLLSTDDFATSAMTLGILICLARLVASGMAQIGPKLAQKAGSALRAAGWVQAVAAAAAFAAISQTTLGTIVVFVGIYVLSAPIMVLTATELHQHVGAEHRNTLLSAMSLAAMAGAGLMALLISVTNFSHVTYGVIAGCAVALSVVPAMVFTRRSTSPLASAA